MYCVLLYRRRGYLSIGFSKMVNQYQRYFETSVELIQSGVYDGIAHPDCIKLFGHTPTFSLDKYYEEMAQALSAQNMYVEQSSGIRDKKYFIPLIHLDCCAFHVGEFFLNFNIILNTLASASFSRK